MSFPAEGIESAYKNSIDDVREYLELRHHNNYIVVNVSPRQYKTARLNDRVGIIALKHLAHYSYCYRFTVTCAQ